MTDYDALCERLDYDAPANGDKDRYAAARAIRELRADLAEANQYRHGHLPTCGGYDTANQTCGCDYLDGTAYRELHAEVERLTQREIELVEALDLTHNDRHYVEGLRQGYDDARKDRDLEVERLRALLRLCIPSLQKDGRPHVVTLVQAALGDIVAISGEKP